MVVNCTLACFLYGLVFTFVYFRCRLLPGIVGDNGECFSFAGVEDEFGQLLLICQAEGIRSVSCVAIWTLFV